MFIFCKCSLVFIWSVDIFYNHYKDIISIFTKKGVYDVNDTIEFFLPNCFCLYLKGRKNFFQRINVYGWTEVPPEEKEKQSKSKLDLQLNFPFFYEDDANKLWEKSKERREEFSELRKKAHFQHQEMLKNFQQKSISAKYEQNFIFS